MRTDRLDKEIMVQRSTEVIDAYGVPNIRWTTIHELRAEVAHAASDEPLFSTDRMSGSAIIFRTGLASIKPTDRIVCESRVYDIQETKEIGRGQGLEIRAIERVGS